MAADGLVCENDPLVLDVNGEKLTFVQKFKGGGTIRVGKFTVSGAPLVGAPYGALFEVTADGRRLQRVLLPPADEITRVTDTDKDNSKLNDRNTENQKLTQDHIEELKKSGKAGAEIVEALCSNSATFQNKTEFSQDKYKRRKAKKYNTYLTVRKPIARIICDAYYDKAPERVWYLRHDSLAVLLSLANVAAGAKVLVVESCMGVVTAAAVERLGGVGSVCALQLDDRPAPVDAVRQMNLSPAQRSVLFTALASSLLRDRSRENGQGGRGWGRGDRGRGRGGGGGRWNGGGGGRGEGGGSGRGGRGKRGAEDGGTGASPGAKRQAL
ncbi:tRNA (adenine(58)-N(1))-methyltransferase non-catalytic subunit trm6 [Tetrabaena socialis]|uniref:tRNA (adenine(58)-N(1))-methyltransferase non-catalytic subunit TRM6 n=1 Tax=Tetrabaena socialis TaxID=47790 RepID=A0A2J8AGV3_9CHLO|nr:tRNA (adenine(58)-N(1))-methyltransferase non-catalytic subunit trm6 [Tetrabaena socialis]|eukprot:PNH11755.1 tRNA (adenine(58)-N(1))-methyltransferase non-catalytic subunit trm6 [Tetrabaena socialis]